MSAAGRPQATMQIMRGTLRMLRARDLSPLAELTLGNGRRADIVAVGRRGEIWIVEVKSSLEDYRADHKWQEYDGYCDRFFSPPTPEWTLAFSRQAGA